MCESNVYVIDENGQESLFFESVDRVIPQENGLLLENIMGQKKLIKARIKELALVRHKIILEREWLKPGMIPGFLFYLYLGGVLRGSKQICLNYIFLYYASIRPFLNFIT